jgi:hypothetical protein
MISVYEECPSYENERYLIRYVESTDVRLTDVATTEELLRIIQSIPSKKEESFSVLSQKRSVAP